MMGTAKKVSQQSNSTFGLTLLFLSLCMDGICGMQQDIVIPRYKPSSLRLQVMLNIYGIGVSLITAILQGELLPGIRFLAANHLCLWVCMSHGNEEQYAVQFGLCSSVGQMFILYTVRHFPPLVLSTITTTRKFFSILISVIFMGNDINRYQVVTLLLVNCSGWVFFLCSLVFSLTNSMGISQKVMEISYLIVCSRASFYYNAIL